MEPLNKGHYGTMHVLCISLEVKNVLEIVKTVEPPNKDTFGTSHFVLYRKSPLKEDNLSTECVYIYTSTFGLSFAGRFVLFRSVQASLYV